MKKWVNWCSLFWTSFFILIGLIFYQGHSTQINTEKDKFNIIETTTGSITGTPEIRGSVGLELGFSQEGLKIFLQDVSAPSGSQFIEITDFDNEFQILADAGDRIYFGVNIETAIRPYGIKAQATVAKSSETLIAKYYSIVADDLVETNYVVLVGDCLDQNNNKLWEVTRDEWISVPRNIHADWAANDNVLDKIPNTGDLRYWYILEVPPGGLATPARIRDVAWRGSGISKLDCNNQDILWGLAKLKKSIRVPFIDFWDGGIPVTTVIPITNTLSQTVHILRSGQNDVLHRTLSFPYGIDTSMPAEICISFTSNQAINTADIELDIYITDRNGGLLGLVQTSDLIVTKNINVSGTYSLQTSILASNIDISNVLENYTLFVQITRTDGNGGQFYPIDFFFDFYKYKMGKF